MDYTIAKQLADARGEVCVLATVGGKSRWLMSKPSSTVDELAQAMTGDAWNCWASGNMAAYDAAGNLLVDDDSVKYDWAATQQPVYFCEMTWYVAVVCGMGRAKLVSRHMLHSNATKAQQKRRHETTRIVFLPASQQLGDEVVI